MLVHHRNVLERISVMSAHAELPIEHRALIGDQARPSYVLDFVDAYRLIKTYVTHAASA